MPLLFSGLLTSSGKLASAVVGFLAFTLVASVVYILNDIRDRDLDKLHPRKKYRPIASGTVKVGGAYVFGSVLFCCAIALQLIVHGSIASFGLLFGYLAINIAYSMGLKNIPIVDIVILSAGFLIRVLYGGEIVSVEVSQWLCLVVLAFSIYLSLGKRHGEIKTGAGTSRKVNQFYDQNFLDKNMYVCLALTIVFYSLWVVEVSAKQHPLLFWTIPLVIVTVMLYSFDIEKPNVDADPSSVLFGDKALLSLAVIYGLSVIGIMYF